MIEKTVQGRHELKYYINYINYFILKNRLEINFSKDNNSTGQGWYHVRSLYFDNKSNNSYYEKLSGIEKRNKYRIRIYNLDQNPVKLEIKSKINNIIIKDSAIIKSSDVDNILSGKYDCLLNYDNPAASKVYYEFSRDFYTPVVLIDYKRDAYNLGINDIRITFDSEIKKSEVGLSDLFSSRIDMTNVLGNNNIIMEIKYNSFIPTWLKNLLYIPGFERCAISKYTLSRYMEK
jgi:SPX domain protein involved in polyphosphate accumulation